MPLCAKTGNMAEVLDDTKRLSKVNKCQMKTYIKKGKWETLSTLSICCTPTDPEYLMAIGRVGQNSSKSKKRQKINQKIARNNQAEISCNDDMDATINFIQVCNVAKIQNQDRREQELIVAKENEHSVQMQPHECREVATMAKAKPLIYLWPPECYLISVS